MTLRLTDQQAAELEAIARVENVPIAEEVRIALEDRPPFGDAVGPLVERDRLGAVARLLTGVAMGSLIKDKSAGERLLRQSDLDWTIIYASQLSDGAATGSVELLPGGTKRRITYRISRADVADARVMDVCCGAGNLGLAIARNKADCRVWGADISEDAVGLANRNAAYLGLQDRAGFEARCAGGACHAQHSVCCRLWDDRLVQGKVCCSKASGDRKRAVRRGGQNGRR